MYTIYHSLTSKLNMFHLNISLKIYKKSSRQAAAQLQIKLKYRGKAISA